MQTRSNCIRMLQRYLQTSRVCSERQMILVKTKSISEETQILNNFRTCTYIHTNIHVQICTCTYSEAYTHTHTHTHTKRWHTNTNITVYTRIHIQSCIQSHTHSPDGKGYGIHRLDMTLNNLMVRLQSLSLGECRVPLHCHHCQVHSDPEW